MPRFGLGRFARRVPAVAALPEVEIRGDLARPLRLRIEHLQSVPQVEQRSDFHCVTTWSVCAVRWSGWRFAEVYERILRPQAAPHAEAELVVFRGADGYACCLQLADLLAADVLLADRINGQALGPESTFRSSAYIIRFRSPRVASRAERACVSRGRAVPRYALRFAQRYSA